MDAGLPPSGFRTGYVDLFAARLRKLSPKIQVVNYGCPGESTKTFIIGGCPWLGDEEALHDAFKGAQLAAALAFVRAHPGRVSPITLTLWGNDLFDDFAPACKGDPLCIQSLASAGLARFESRFGKILGRLRSAAPTAEIIVTGAWNFDVEHPDEDRSSVPLDRRRDRARGGDGEGAGGQDLPRVQPRREACEGEGPDLLADVHLHEGRSASDRRRVPRDGERLHGRVGLPAVSPGPASARTLPRVSVHRLTKAQARRIAVRAQLLDARRPTDLLEVVGHLMFLQLDPTAAIAPSADLVAWTRMGDAYRPEHLTDALEQDRTLYEVRAFIRPMADLGPLPRRDGGLADREGAARSRGGEWLKENDAFRKDVLKLLKKSGPLMSRDVPDTSVVPWQSTGWTGNRNVTQMLEFLNARGEVAVSGRVGRQRLWISPSASTRRRSKSSRSTRPA